MSKEREALERICEIIRRENPAGAAHRIESYMDAIKEMKDVAVEADDDTRRGAALMAVEHFTGHGREFAKDVSTVIYGIAYEAEEGLAVPEAEEGHMPTEEELRDLYRDKREKSISYRLQKLPSTAHSIRAVQRLLMPPVPVRIRVR